MSEGMLTRVVGCDYAFEIWERVKTHFASQTRAKIKQFKTQLRSTKKGSLKMYDYLLKIKSIVDSLASVGSPVPINDYIEAIFYRLPDEYEFVITTVLSKFESYSIDEIESLLLSQENRLERKVQVQILDSANNEDTGNFLASVAQIKNMNGRNSNGGVNGNFFPGRGRGGQRNFSNRSGRRGGRNFQNNYQGFQGSQVHQFSAGGQKPYLICQLCGKTGHSVWSYYHRFDPNFQIMQTNNQSLSNSRPQGQLSAMYASLESTYDPC